MAEVEDPIGPITSTWPIADIVYVSLIGIIILAALLEWMLWLAAFLYCLTRAYQKAEDNVTRYLAVVMIVMFTTLRLMFLPVMVVTLPLPYKITQYYPSPMVFFFQWFAFWSFAILLTVPWLFCVYQLVTKTLGRKKRIKEVLDETSAPKVVIVMPCYKEIPDVLLTAIDSIVTCDYPLTCLHIFLSFDGDQEDELYLQTISRLGIPLTLNRYPTSIDITYRKTRITVSRFPHGGKRSCQKRTFKLIDKIYAEYLQWHDNLFILFIDSDCILDKVCIQNFIYEMELVPGSKRNMLAMTGVITATTDKFSMITLLQDMEYIHGQLFERSVESGCGAVTCLPGALTILRFSAFRQMAKFYFAEQAEHSKDLFDYGKCHLGEDRWLTHLFMIGATGRNQIQMCTSAFCKTEAVQSFHSLLKQRRRWFLGFITNEVCMLTDIRIWKRYTLLCSVRFMQNTIRTTALLFFIMVMSIITTSNRVKNLPVGFIAVSLGLNWALMIYFGIRLHRFKVWLYPLMFIINPFFNWLYMVYGIFTAGQRTWGGPRADAGAADQTTTVQEAIEHAEATGDDLNVIPETFRPAGEGPSTAPRLQRAVPLQPTDRAEGRFVAAERRAPWYDQAQESLLSLTGRFSRQPFAGRQDESRISPSRPGPGDSAENISSVCSSDGTVSLPKRIENVMLEQDFKRYFEMRKVDKSKDKGETTQKTKGKDKAPQRDEQATRVHDWIVPVDSEDPNAHGIFSGSPAPTWSSTSLDAYLRNHNQMGHELRSDYDPDSPRKRSLSPLLMKWTPPKLRQSKSSPYPGLTPPPVHGIGNRVFADWTPPHPSGPHASPQTPPRASSRVEEPFDSPSSAKGSRNSRNRFTRLLKGDKRQSRHESQPQIQDDIQLRSTPPSTGDRPESPTPSPTSKHRRFMKQIRGR